ncbi:MAG: DUF1579 domain-containing protein [Sphingopyxis sp.]|nr:DUF1579 domain-containing protein [Sphingopyxis sp.]
MATAAHPSLPDGFDFLLGQWRVLHRKRRLRLKGSDDWFEFRGTLDVSPILAGAGNVDLNDLDDPDGRYQATSLRLFDASRGEWSIYWIDGRHAGIDKPVVGFFKGPIGKFYSDDSFEGRPIRVRFIYEDLGPRDARWSQAFSDDRGANWETNWIMEFTRNNRA